MEQSIASSQATVTAERPPKKHWKSHASKLWSAIMAKRHTLHSDPPYFVQLFGSDSSPTLDIERIGSRLRVNSRAKFDGINEQPPATAEAMSGTQSEIVSYFKELHRRAQSQVSDVADRLRRLREQMDLQQTTASIRDIPSRCENDVLRFTAEFQSQLNSLEEEETQLQQRCNAFLENNKSNQFAKHRTSTVLRLATIAVLIGAPAIAFDRFVAPGPGGEALIPSSRAVAIASVAALAPFLLALIVSRFVNDVRRLERFAGWLLGGVTIAFVGTLALFATYYISELSHNPDATVRGVVDSILAAPSAILTDLTRWASSGSDIVPRAGFAIVIVAGSLAFLVGYRFDEPDSAYTGLRTARNCARRRRERVTRRLRKRINAIIDSAEVETTEALRRLKSQFREYSRLLGNSRHLPAALSDYDVALEDACNILLDRYRSTNTIARQTAVPLSFSEHICFQSEHECATSLLSKEDNRLAELQQSVADIESQAFQVLQQLRELNRQAITALGDSADYTHEQ